MSLKLSWARVLHLQLQNDIFAIPSRLSVGIYEFLIVLPSYICYSFLSYLLHILVIHLQIYIRYVYLWFIH